MRMWVKILIAFGAASASQILFYGAPSLLGFGSYRYPDFLYAPVTLAFIGAPAVMALVFSLRSLRAVHRQAGDRVSGPEILGVVLLSIVSAYGGVLVSFNVFGT